MEDRLTVNLTLFCPFTASNVNGGSSDVKSSVEEPSEGQVSTQATDDTVKYDASTLHPESSQSDSTLECEPMDDVESKYYL